MVQFGSCGRSSRHKYFKRLVDGDVRPALDTCWTGGCEAGSCGKGANVCGLGRSHVLLKAVNPRRGSSSAFVLGVTFLPRPSRQSTSSQRALQRDTPTCIHGLSWLLAHGGASFRKCHPASRLGGGSVEITTLNVEFASRSHI